MEENEQKKDEQNKTSGQFMIIGIGVGIALGSAMGNVGLGLALGISIGMMVDAYAGKKGKDTPAE